MTASDFSIRQIPASQYYPVHSHTDELLLYVVQNAFGKMVVSEQGAQVLSFIPDNQSDLLWLSPLAQFTAGKAIRGGIPVCLPWFGVNRHAANTPSHGFARNVNWQLATVSQAQHSQLGDCTQLVFTLAQFADQPHTLFPFSFSAQLSFSFNQSLAIDLQLTNTGGEAFPLSWALHSYHPVNDLSKVKVKGLDGVSYLDNIRSLERRVQQGDVGFAGEVDRVFIDVPGAQQIDDIAIAATGSATAIVWNPGYDKACAMADLGGEHYRQFVCVERGNAFDNELRLLPGASTLASVTISRTKL